MIKAIGMIAVLAGIVFLGFFALNAFSSTQKPEGRENLSILSEKIDEVLKNQQAIIAQLEDIRKQQDIIRVRASRK